MIQSIRISSIKIDDGTQSRVTNDEETVKSYAAYIENGATLPPVIIFHHEGIYRLADGYHRVAAHKLLNRDVIQADIKEGDKRAAMFYSVGANTTNGLRRTNADKRHTIEMVLGDKESAKLSNNEIAAMCGVSPNTVKTVRESLSTQIAEIDQPDIRTGKRNGKAYNIDTKNIGKTKLASHNSKSPVPSDAPRKGDGPIYFVHMAKNHLGRIDPTDPVGKIQLLEMRDWIDQQLAEKNSTNECEATNSLAIPSDQSDESVPSQDNLTGTGKGGSDDNKHRGKDSSPAENDGDRVASGMEDSFRDADPTTASDLPVETVSPEASGGSATPVDARGGGQGGDVPEADSETPAREMVPRQTEGECQAHENCP
ncbi:MAG: ParB N-terminal domain-containing protein [Spirochaetales bacterium]|nr:ParB N-terminal domain-containing protein [Spirochaetales bacterium]